VSTYKFFVFVFVGGRNDQMNCIMDKVHIVVIVKNTKAMCLHVN